MIYLEITFVVCEWLSKTKQNVEINDIVERYKELSVTSCHVRCKLNEKCKSIGMKKNIKLAATGECFLLAGNVSNYSENPTSETTEMYVTKTVSSNSY